MMKTRKLLMLSALVVAGAVAVWVYFNFLKTDPSMHRQKAELQVSAIQLYNDFDEDETAANQKYLNKVIEVKGSIDSIEKGDDSKPVVLLSTEGFGLIKASLESEEELQALSDGQIEVEIRGECIGLLLDVLMINCIVVKK